MRFLVLLAALLLGLSAPAHADDISAAGRGVVRVVTIASAEGQIVGFGHGSGLAIAPNRIVTNAHVVELAARYPDNVVIGIVPSEGAKSYRGKLIAYDAQRDLALIEFTGTQLPPLTLYPGPVTDGEAVIALGYPGNVDLATAQSAADYIRPLGPVRSQGGFAGRRQMSSVEVLLHTASIARGNSGGPLLDPCGRVIGVNSAITRTEEGDSSFGFAIADTELAAFLREAKQPFATTSVPCTSIEQRLQQDKETSAQRAEREAQAAQAAAAELAAQRSAAIERARENQAWLRENFIGGATLLLVLGSLALSGAGLLETRGSRRGAAWALGGGLVLMIGAIILFFARPFGEVKVAALPATTATPDGKPPIAEGKMVCRIAPERSRINTSTPSDVTIDWGKDGCMDAQVQYVENGSRWERIVVPPKEQTVSIIEYRPTERVYTESRYLLNASAMDQARKLKSGVTIKACTPNEADRQKLAQQQAAIRDALPTQPDEWLVYDCAAAK
ncbi:MAG: trypsin-like peptidase domain-containing protein [Sphingomonas sp.]|nr:trypsin-like peptidase domain-containing protein [Sphingomonas sp.]